MDHKQLFKANATVVTESENNILSVLIGNKTINYAVYNDNSNLLELSVVTNTNPLLSSDISAVLNSEPFNSINYKNASIGLVSEFAVIPQEYFDDNKMEAYLAKQLGKDYKVAYSYDILENPNVRIVYKKDNELIMQLNSFLKHTKIYNSISPLIKNMIANYTSGTAILNNFFEDQFDYICLKNGKLQMANRYNCDTPENYLYYLLNAMKINKTSTKTSSLLLSGAIKESDHHTKLSKNYLPNINLINNSFDEHENTISLSKHYNLQALAKCV